MSDLKEFKLPDVGEGLTEAEIVTWKVKPGDTVKINDIIVEIETAKSLVELPSPFAGTIAELLVPEGETVAVGTPIITVAPAGTAVPAAPEEGAAPETGGPAEKAAPETVGPAEEVVPTPKEDQAVEPGLIGGPGPGGRTSVLVGYGPRTTDAKRRPRKGGAVPAGPAAAELQAELQAAFQPGAQAEDEMPVSEAPSTLPGVSEPLTEEMPASAGSAKPLAKPPVRKLAKNLGVDLRAVTPTGDGGVVTRADVEAFASEAGAAEAQEGAPSVVRQVARLGERETRVPIKGVRKMTAQAMVGSAFSAPHVTEWVTVDVSRTMELVDAIKAHRDFREVKVSPLLVIAKAVCLAVRRTPEVNARWDEQAQEVVLKHYVNLGIAAATPRGLVVPNVKDADAMSLRELADALTELATTARQGKTQPAEMASGTITITNVGVFGVDAGTPIINPGESAILCVGAIKKQPWVVGDEIKPRWVTTLALSFDHRLVDGEQGSKFLADVAAILEEPGTALLH
jgi:2-oxoisovalerate dehydrogenase E2 component (dihydrolipoyl transacylase)